MKCSESWLREWVNPNLTAEVLCETLTMAGLEIEGLTPVVGPISNVVIGKVLQVTKHPEADRLTICQVDVGKQSPLTIVCGAKNVAAGIYVPVALVGAILPNMKIIRASVRGVESEGMLCSATELGLSETSDGLFILPSDAPLGKDIVDYLQLNDHVIEVSITPNRGDCLSIKGLAREVAALTGASIHPVKITPSVPQITDELPIKIQAIEACPLYVGRVIKDINLNATAPIWLTERLRRAGIRSIHPVVDITNYVMLELGQPMHAFDLQAIDKEINVRWSKVGEKLFLLDSSEKELNAESLVIADAKSPLALAGVMGGTPSSVTLTTKDIFLESAYFSPVVVARQRQYYQLHSDSSYRFERGIDPTLQRLAIERATDLILQIAEGKPGPITEVVADNYLPKSKNIAIEKQKISNVLGIDIPDQTIDTIFKSLQFNAIKSETKKGWMVEILAYRHDISLPEDLIEEIARLYGYNNIPTHDIKANLQPTQINEYTHRIALVRQIWCDLGYQEIVSYSFVDKSLQQLLDPDATWLELINPITAEMSVMRTNLWSGLLNTLRYNLSRQQDRVRLFELGVVFHQQEKQIRESAKLAGLIMGPVAVPQWGVAPRSTDFYDLKGDIEQFLTNFCDLSKITFQKTSHPALHPGQTAAIYLNGKLIGIMGGLHPSILQALEIEEKIYIFEMDIAEISLKTSQFQEISKFPEIRRDLAILVNETIPVNLIQDTIKNVAGDWLKETFVFDVYQGKGIAPELKSIALALILQHPSRTLVDEEVAALIERVVNALKEQLEAQLRS